MNPERLIIGHININSIRNKFEALTEIIKDKLDIFMISETKLDSSFTVGQFCIDGYSKLFRSDRDEKGGGIMLYIREGIPSKILHSKFNQKDKEYFLVELNLRKRKWLLVCSYNPHKSFTDEHLALLGRELDSHSWNYDDIIILGDFNSEPNKENMKRFYQIYNLKNLINEPTCYKNPENPSTIDLILTNKPRSFQNSCTFETGLSDFHKMTITVLKMHFKKQASKIISYRNYKNFSNLEYRKKVQEIITKIDFQKIT